MSQRYAYYPGCSLEASAVEYDLSTKSVLRALGVELEEIPDWSCCGASAGHAVSKALALALPARDLARAEMGGADVVAPCPACYKNLRHVRESLEEEAGRAKVERLLEGTGLSLSGKVQVKHLLEVLATDIGAERIAEAVQVPLEGLKVVTYYGCYIARPGSMRSFDDPVEPVTMDVLCRAAGAAVLPFTRKVRCCGAPVMMSSPEEMHRLSYEILKEAKQRGADAVVVACPLCHHSLDAAQPEIEKHHGKLEMPVLYITQVLGLALGLHPWDELGLDRNVVSTLGIVKRFSKVECPSK